MLNTGGGGEVPGSLSSNFYELHIFVQELTKALPSVVKNGDTSSTYPGCVNLSFHCVEGESLLMALKVPVLVALTA
jgi:cysteine sulfinate desulfinase/cysteine desulfurase-like protein